MLLDFMGLLIVTKMIEQINLDYSYIDMIEGLRHATITSQKKCLELMLQHEAMSKEQYE